MRPNNFSRKILKCLDGLFWLKQDWLPTLLSIQTSKRPFECKKRKSSSFPSMQWWYKIYENIIYIRYVTYNDIVVIKLVIAGDEGGTERENQRDWYREKWESQLFRSKFILILILTILPKIKTTYWRFNNHNFSSLLHLCEGPSLISMMKNASRRYNPPSI